MDIVATVRELSVDIGEQIEGIAEICDWAGSAALSIPVRVGDDSRPRIRSTELPQGREYLIVAMPPRTL
ncbi:hypothetical protein [Nocardia heshunensis]